MLSKIFKYIKLGLLDLNKKFEQRLKTQQRLEFPSINLFKTIFKTPNIINEFNIQPDY